MAPASIYRPFYQSRYPWQPRVHFDPQLGPAGHVNSASINANSSTASPYSVSLGVACLAGDLIVVSAASNGTHATNGMSVFDSTNGILFPTVAEVQNSNASTRYTQAFAFVTPVDLASTTLIWFTPYVGATLSGFVVDIFRGWTATQVASSPTSNNSPLGPTEGAPGFATRPPIGSLVIVFQGSASAASLGIRAPFTIGSTNNTNDRATIGYAIATGVDPYDSTIDLGSSQSWGVINAAFLPGFGPVGAPFATPSVFRSAYMLPYLRNYRWQGQQWQGVIGTGNQFSQSLTAGLSFTGSGPQKAVAKSMAAGLSFTGAGPKNAITKTLAAASLSFTGALSRATTYPLVAAVLSFTGSGPLRSVGKVLTATLSFTGSGPVRAIAKVLTAALSFTGAQNRSTAKQMTGGLSFSGAMTRATNYHLVSAVLSFAGNVIGGKFLHSNLTGTLSFTGALASAHAYHQALTAALSFTGVQTRAASKRMTAALSFTGAQSRATSLHLTGALSFTGAIKRADSKRMAAVLSFLGSLNFFNPNAPKIYEPILMQAASVMLNVLGQRAAVVPMQGSAETIGMQGPNGNLTVVGGKTGIEEGD